MNENFDKNFKYLISIGRLTYQKNFILLIKGFYEIKKIYKEYEFQENEIVNKSVKRYAQKDKRLSVFECLFI